MRKRNHVILFALASAVMLGCVPAYAEETGETKEIQIFPPVTFMGNLHRMITL